MEKVYCVFQSSGSYDMFYNELKFVCKTKELAEEKKKELDKLVVNPNNLWSVIPEDIYENWPFRCEDEENDIWSPEELYEGYTITHYFEQLSILENYSKEYNFAEIEEFELI